MKRMTLLLATLLLISSCNESTRDRRLAYGTSTSVNPVTNPSYNLSGGTTTPTPTPTATTSGSNSNVVIPSDATHCSWSTDGATGFASTSTHLGKYTLCKSSTSDSNILYLQLATVPSTQVCIIPTTTLSSYGTTYIGEPRCIQVTSNTTIYKITMLKNRSGYTGATMTGAMMMKDLVYYSYGYPYMKPYYAVDAYLLCFQYLYYGDARYCSVFNARGEHVFQAF